MLAASQSSQLYPDSRFHGQLQAT